MKEILRSQPNQVEPNISAWKRSGTLRRVRLSVMIEAAYLTRQQAGSHGLTEDTRFIWQQKLVCQTSLATRWHCDS